VGQLPDIADGIVWPCGGVVEECNEGGDWVPGHTGWCIGLLLCWLEAPSPCSAAVRPSLHLTWAPKARLLTTPCNKYLDGSSEGYMVGLLCTCSSSTEAASIKPTKHLATVFSLLQRVATINPGYLRRLDHVASSDGSYDIPIRIYPEGLLRSLRDEKLICEEAAVCA